MCVVSNIGTGWAEDFPQRYPWAPPFLPPVAPAPVTIITTGVDQEEFDRLKQEVEELKKLLAAAKEFDAATGQRDCEMDEKVALIKRVAEYVGVDLQDVFE